MWLYFNQNTYNREFDCFSPVMASINMDASPLLPASNPTPSTIAEND